MKKIQFRSCSQNFMSFSTLTYIFISILEGKFSGLKRLSPVGKTHSPGGNSKFFCESGGTLKLIRPSVTKTLTWLIYSEVLMIEHWYLACMIRVTSPLYWYHAVILTLSFDLLQGQSCCRAGDHNSPNLLVLLFFSFKKVSYFISNASLQLKKWNLRIFHDPSFTCFDSLQVFDILPLYGTLRPGGHGAGDNDLLRPRRHLGSGHGNMRGRGRTHVRDHA